MSADKKIKISNEEKTIENYCSYDVLKLILSFLDFKSALKACLVRKRWLTAARSNDYKVIIKNSSGLGLFPKTTDLIVKNSINLKTIEFLDYIELKFVTLIDCDIEESFQFSSKKIVSVMYKTVMVHYHHVEINIIYLAKAILRIPSIKYVTIINQRPIQFEWGKISRYLTSVEILYFKYLHFDAPIYKINNLPNLYRITLEGSTFGNMQMSEFTKIVHPRLKIIEILNEKIEDYNPLELFNHFENQGTTIVYVPNCFHMGVKLRYFY